MQTSLIWKNTIACALLLVCLALPQHFASAQTTNSLGLPTNPANTKGFVATVSWVDSEAPGYIPITIDVSSTSVFAADKRLTFSLQPIKGGHSPPQNGITIEIPVNIDQNTKRKTVTKYVPKWSVGNYYRVDVFDDGSRLQYYSGNVGKSLVQNWYSPPTNFLADENRLNMTVIADVAKATSDKALKSLLVATITSQATNQVASSQAIMFANQFQNAQANMAMMAGYDPTSFSSGMISAVRPSQMQADWRAYQSTDAVLVSADQLQIIKDTQPEAFLGLRNWVFCGGTVVVLNVSTKQEAASIFGVKFQLDETATLKLRSSITQERNSRSSLLASLEQYLLTLESTQSYLKTLQKRALAKRKAADKASASGNSPAEPAIDYRDLSVDDDAYLELAFEEDFTSNSIPGGVRTGMGQGGTIASMVRNGMTLKECEDTIASTQTAINELKNGPKSNRIASQMWIQDVGAGRLIGMHKDCAYGNFEWEILARTFDYRRSPMLRRGVDPLLGDRRASNWLIEGVAQPPVYIFMCLLALFMILVGPIAYRKTHKAGRGYLMFAIAPALALVTTLVMFTYGVMADGFGTVSRIRQLTWVDGESGDGGERVRGTYFAGVRPSEGLSFAGDAEVMSYENPNGKSWEDFNRDEFSTLGTVVVRDERQQFDNAFIPSRAQKQFVVHQPRPKIGRLVLTPNAVAGEPPTVSSSFDFELREVTLFDKNAVAWIVDKIPAGAESIACKKIDKKLYSKRLADLYNDFRPIGTTRNHNRDRNRQTSNRGYSHTVDLINLVNKPGYGGSYSVITDGSFEYPLQVKMKLTDKPPADAFFSIADVSEDVIAVEGAELSQSVRFVFGTLP